MDSSAKLTIEELTMYAKQALENPILKIALEDLRTTAWFKFQASQARDSEAREFIYWFLKAVNEFQGQLNVYLSEENVKNTKEKTPEELFQEKFDIA